MNFLKNISTKVKLFFAFILSIISFFAYIGIQSKIKAKDKLKHDLESIKSELKITELEKATDDKIKKINELQIQEEIIKEKIKFVEQKEYEGIDVSLEELDSFFDKRGL